jgi:hypothetical protein
VADRAAHHAKTTYGGKAGRAKYGMTAPSKMCAGVKYAKGVGYPGSRCWKLNGTEFNKFEHVHRYLSKDRPAILLMHADGVGFVNHYVVIEGARILQEKKRGKWRNREVQYLINWGGGNKKSEWITVRKRGFNRGKKVYSAASIYLVNINRKLPHAKDVNHEACQEWCSPGKGCKMCSKTRNCGPGYRRQKLFNEAGPNWSACKTRGTKRSKASEGNRTACEAWCNKNKPTCKMCSTTRNCGIGYKRMKLWSGYGNNWSACKKKGPSAYKKKSDRNHANCDKWCNANKKKCAKCSTKRNCGIGFKNLRSWGHKLADGRAWHACAISGFQKKSDNNKSNCEAWCKKNKPRCVKCSTKRHCGGGLSNLKSWGAKIGDGRAWHACKKRPSRKQASKNNKEACLAWCAKHKPKCIGCSTKRNCGWKKKRMKLWDGRGTNYSACRKR